jgi:hypothetical protein
MKSRVGEILLAVCILIGAGALLFWLVRDGVQ